MRSRIGPKRFSILFGIISSAVIFVLMRSRVSSSSTDVYYVDDVLNGYQNGYFAYSIPAQPDPDSLSGTGSALATQVL